ncbi:MAG: twin-arginine translocase TatA/TatE family subunit [Pseudomonadota bacterium]
MNVNFAEIGVVCVVALLLFGPEQLPQIARQVGKLAADLRKVSNSVRREWYNAVYPPASEVRRDLEAGQQTLRTLRAQVLAPPTGSQPAPTADHRKDDIKNSEPADASSTAHEDKQ